MELLRTATEAWNEDYYMAN